MKKALLFLAAMGMVLFASCDKEPKPELKVEPKPFPIGTWRATHYYYSRIVSDVSLPGALETIKEREEQELSIDVSDAYRITLNENGTGFGPECALCETEYLFEFSWGQPSDGLFELYGSDFIIISPDADLPILWDTYDIEESSAGSMVLSRIMFGDVDGSLDDDTPVAYYLTDTERYTFERVD